MQRFLIILTTLVTFTPSIRLHSLALRLTGQPFIQYFCANAPSFTASTTTLHRPWNSHQINSCHAHFTPHHPPKKPENWWQRVCVTYNDPINYRPLNSYAGIFTWYLQLGSILWSLWSLFINQPSSVRGWISAFLLAVHRLCCVIEGRLGHFLPRWLRTGWRSAISQGKIPWNTLPWLGIEPGQRGGQTVSYPTELSWSLMLTEIFTWYHGIRSNSLSQRDFYSSSWEFGHSNQWIGRVWDLLGSGLS